jgi:hypothetical protein
MRQALGENLNLVMLGRIGQLVGIFLENRPVLPNAL